LLNLQKAGREPCGQFNIGWSSSPTDWFASTLREPARPAFLGIISFDFRFSRNLAVETDAIAAETIPQPVLFEPSLVNDAIDPTTATG